MFHRDLSPEALVLDRLGLIKVVDLGLAKTPEQAEAEEAVLTGKQVARSTRFRQCNAALSIDRNAGLQAPELSENPAGAGPRTDIYSLGCTFYFLLAGRPPFEGTSTALSVHRQQTEPNAPPDEPVDSVPKALWAITARMTARRPEERYSGMGDVIRDLEGVLGVSSASASSQ